MTTPTRTRLPRAQRQQQLLDTAWALIRQKGTDELSLGRLAEAAGVAKPVAYDHFGTREGLLAALWKAFVTRQQARLDTALAANGTTLQERIAVIADTHIHCVLEESREIPQVLAALSGSAALAQMKKQCQRDFLQQYRALLTPFLGSKGLTDASLWAIVGAADTLAQLIVEQDLSAAQAQMELRELLFAAVKRSWEE